MRLLNTTTLELREFFGEEIPRYAILSHRWEEGEITFKDVTKSKNLDAAGWRKVWSCCEFVHNNGYRWVWIDTCCIDKKSSAELSEAINSMYKWYENAHICFAFLNDVSCKQTEVRDLVNLSDLEDEYHSFGYARWYQSISKHSECSQNTLTALRKSDWFTRGWTLQELIAPELLCFVDKDWRIFGNKTSLRNVLSEITGIKSFSHAERSEASVAMKMSWASKRSCARSEDRAYSLMGLFGINMPLLYGEGEANAFRRLQLEIMKVSEDESLFAWYEPDLWAINSGMLAQSPDCFVHSSNIRPFTPAFRRAPYAMTNKGLEISTVLLHRAGNSPKKYVLFLPLNCHREGELLPLAIRIKCRGDRGQFIYTRVPPMWEDDCDDPLRWPQDLDAELLSNGISTIHITGDFDHQDGIENSKMLPKEMSESLQGAVTKYLPKKARSAHQ